VWTETNRVLEVRSARDLDLMLGGTARQVYNIQQR
jgi:hypothetical protein